MAARIKSTFNKVRGKDKDSGHHGPANDPPELDPRGGLAQSNPAEHINQPPTASKENKAELKDEYGIKVLHAPEQPRAEYALIHCQLDDAKEFGSVVFIHGLTGRQLSTWTAPGATTPWPSLLLSDDIPDARISAFGYDANVVNLLGPAGQNRIRDHASNLLRGIADMWLETGVDGLPILFVAHSLGGLVCQNALTIANNAEQHEKRILEYTKAITFLGTPHRGSDLATWATVAGNMIKLVRFAKTNILEVLKPNSEVLENLTRDFHTMLRSREQAGVPSIDIVCFVEELPVSKAGKTFMVVPPKSASLERYPYVTIHTDHIGITKFTERNDDYKRIMLQLKRWIQQLTVSEKTLDGIIEPTKSDLKTSNLVGLNASKKSVIYFVLRNDLLKELDIRLLSNPEATNVVLLGMGGSGKTQLALECCRRAEADSSFTAVIWLDALSPVTVAQSYNNIALKMTSGDQSTTDVEESMAIVERRLQQQKGKWLIVLDNFDNPKDFQKHNIQYYIPKATDGRVLVTSRHASSERLGHVIGVSGMTDDESLDLLLQRPTSDATERQQGLAIAAMLGYLALALDQAGAYVRARCLPLQDFESHYQRRKKLILEEVPEQWEYRKVLGVAEGETALSVFVTWELSFALLHGDREEKDRKEHFLTLAAYFDNNCISQRYFEAYRYSENTKWAQIFETSNEWDEYKYGDLVAEGRKLSLLQMVKGRANNIQFSLHPVVRDWLKLRMEREKQKLYAEEFSNLLASYIKGIKFDELDLQVRQETLLHIDACLQTDREIMNDSSNSALNQSYSTSLFAACYRSHGRYKDAEMIFKRVLAGREEDLGPDHPDTLQTVQNLAIIYRMQGRYTEAENLYQRALIGREKKLGLDHPDTLQTVQNLAIIYRMQGRYTEAEKLYQRALIGREKKLGPDHPNTLKTVHNLAIVYWNQGRYTEAENLYQRALIGREKKLGLDHPNTLQTVQNLAIIYRMQGRYTEAENLYQRALIGREKKLGLDHPDTLQTVQNLAIIYRMQGRYTEAEKLYQRALIGYEKKLGPDHPDTSRTVNNLAILYQNQKRYDEAKKLFGRALTGREEKLGPGHPDTVKTVQNLAVLYRDQRRYDEAEKLFERALAGMEEKLGPDHPDTVDTVQNLAALYRDQGRYDEAERLLADREMELRPDPPNT